MATPKSKFMEARLELIHTLAMGITDTTSAADVMRAASERVMELEGRLESLETDVELEDARQSRLWLLKQLTLRDIQLRDQKRQIERLEEESHEQRAVIDEQSKRLTDEADKEKISGLEQKVETLERLNQTRREQIATIKKHLRKALVT